MTIKTRPQKGMMIAFTGGTNLKSPRDANRSRRLYAQALLWLAIVAMFTTMTVGAQKTRTPRGRKKPAKESVEPKKSRPKEKDKEKEEVPEDGRGKISDLRSDDQLPRLKELPVPTVEELHKSAVDWIVLKGAAKPENRQVVIVKQVFPRPDTLKKLAAALEELRKKPRPDSEEGRKKLADERAELQNLVIMLPEAVEGQVYEIPTQLIETIIYHEDLVMRRAGILIDEKRFRDAFELLYALIRRVPEWNGMEAQMLRLLSSEADDAVEKNDLESALASLEELHRRDRGYQQVSRRLGEMTDKLIQRSQSVGDFREARHFLGRLARIEPEHEIVAKWNRTFLSDAQKLMASALEKDRGGDHAQAVSMIDRSARIWPATPGLQDAHRKLSNRYQRLQVGVLSLAGAARPFPCMTLADRNERSLTCFDLFEVDRIDDATHYRSRLLEQWEPTDLGRRAVMTLKSTTSRWESRRPMTAMNVLSTMESLLNPSNPAFDERLSNYVQSVHLRSPYEFEVRFTHAPPRTELLFRFPITISGADGSRPGEVLSRRFDKVGETENEAVYRRAVVQPDGLDEYQVAEIVEHEYDSPEHAIQGLFRGDVSLLSDLPTWALPVFTDDPRFFVLRYATPTTHILQFNPQSAPLKSPELRRAMAYAIDARRILSRIVLRDSASQEGRIVTAPFATKSYAYNTLVLPRDRNSKGERQDDLDENLKPNLNLNVAISLYAAATKRLKAVPVLKMACDPGPTARAAALEILNEWKRAGIKAELVSGSQTSNSDPKWDVAYRTLRMEEPLVELWPFLTAEPRARLESLRNLPDWLRQELLALDNAPDWKSAVNRLQELHAHLYEQIAYIPLWEVDDAMVLRKNVRGFPASRLVYTYQNIERWSVVSWFPEDAP